MIEQFGMNRLLAQMTEVVGRAHETFAEEVQPHAIHEDARSERIRFARDAAREFEATAGGWLRARGRAAEDADVAARDFVAELGVSAAHAEALVPGLVPIVRRADRAVGLQPLFGGAIGGDEWRERGTRGGIVREPFRGERFVEQAHVLAVAAVLGPARDGGEQCVGETRGELILRFGRCVGGKQRRESTEFILRAFAAGVLVNTRDAEPRAFVGDIVFIQAAVAGARREIVVEGFRRDFEIHAARRGVVAAGEAIEVPRGECEPRGLGLIEKRQALGVKRLIHDERARGVFAGGVARGERHGRARREERTAHRARKAHRERVRPAARGEQLREHGVAFVGHDNFAVAREAVLHARAVPAPAGGAVVAREVGEEREVGAIGGEALFAFAQKFFAQLWPCDGESGGVG